MSTAWAQNNGKNIVTTMIKNEHPNDDDHSNLSNNSNTTSSPTVVGQIHQQHVPMIESMYPESATLKNLNLSSTNNLQHEQYSSTHDSPSPFVGQFIRADLQSYTDPLVYYGESMIDPLQQNYPHLQQIIYSPTISSIHHPTQLSYEDGTRSRTILYDNGSLQTWSSNESQHYLPYSTTSIPNINEIAHLQQHPNDQLQYWQDPGTNGTFIQYPDGPSFETSDGHECVVCGTTSTAVWRYDLSGNYMCHDCHLCHRVDSPNRSIQRTARHLEEDNAGRSSTIDNSYSLPLAQSSTKILSSLVHGNSERTYSMKTNDSSKSTATTNNKQPVTNSRRTGLQCANCSTQTTTLWRRNNEGDPVCNACGLYFKLHHVPRPMNMVKEGIQTRRRKQKSNNGTIPAKPKNPKHTNATTTATTSKKAEVGSSEPNMNHNIKTNPEEFIPRASNFSYDDLYPSHMHLLHHTYPSTFEQQQRFHSQAHLDMTPNGFDIETCGRKLVTSPMLASGTPAINTMTNNNEVQHVNVIKDTSDNQP